MSCGPARRLRLRRGQPELADLSWRELDLERWLRRSRVLDLKGRMLDLEAILEQPGQSTPELVTIPVRVDDDVRRERREAGGDLPDVEIVNLDDPALSGERVADLLGVDVRPGPPP